MKLYYLNFAFKQNLNKNKLILFCIFTKSLLKLHTILIIILHLISQGLLYDLPNILAILEWF